MQRLLEDLVTRARSLSSGALTPGVNLFANTMPSSPINCCAVVLSGGFSDPIFPLRNPGFQLLFRGTHPTSMLSLATSVDHGFRNSWNTLSRVSCKIVGSGELSSPVWERTGSFYYISSNYVVTLLHLD